MRQAFRWASGWGCQGGLRRSSSSIDGGAMKQTDTQSGQSHNACGIVAYQNSDMRSTSDNHLSSKGRTANRLASWVLILALSCSPAIFCSAQSTPASVASPQPTSLGEELQRPEGKEIHIF